MRKNLILLTGVCILLMFASCQKTDAFDKISQSNRKAVVSAGQEPLVIEQLKWIARGIPDLADPNQPFRQIVENLCYQMPGEFYATNADIQSDATSQIATDYEVEVFNNVNSRFPSNNYDPSFFYEIEIDGCMNIVGIRIPELDIADMSKKLVVLPEDPFTNGGDSIYGYFLNDTIVASPPILDSILIDEDNMDSVYLWVVGLVLDCLDSTYLAGSGGGGAEGQTPVWWYCDGDGICEPEHGEDETNCADCQTSYVPNQKLILKNIRSKTDRKKFSSNHPEVKYQEAHLQGKYEVCFTYAVVDHNSLTVKDLRKYHSELIGGTVTPYTPPHQRFKAWGKNAEMPRCKRKRRGGTKCNRGCEKDKPQEDVLSYNFNKNDDAIYMLVFERDANRSVTRHDISITDASGSLSDILTLDNHAAPGKPYSWTWNNRTGQMEYVYEILPNDPNHQWIPDPSGGPGEVMILSFDGEIEYTLAIE